MARKPTSVYVILEDPNTEVSGTVLPGQRVTVAEFLGPTRLMAYRIPLEDGEKPEDAAQRGYEAHPIGTVLTWVEDTKVNAHTVGLVLEDIDDPRLTDE